MKKTISVLWFVLMFISIYGQNKDLYDKNPDIIFDGQVLLGNDTLDYRLGYFVDGAGDINNDGFDDIILSAPGYNFDRGKLVIIYGGDSTSGSIPPTELPGNDLYDELGYRVSKAGDINNDGYADIIAGAVKFNNFQGKAVVYYGDASGINDSTILKIDCDSCHFGCAVGGGGDFNGDGYDDVIIGAIHWGDLNGKALLYLGTENGIDTVPAMTLLIPGGMQNLFGWSVSFAGDVNSDGYDDLLVGAVKSDTYTGKMFLFLGSEILDSLPDFVYSGENQYDQLGWDVSGAGDFNNDGYDDFMVSATYYNDSTGRVYIFEGNDTFPPDYTPTMVLTGENTDEYFGRSIRSAGDINADGFDDIIIGIMRYEDYTGKAYLFLGGNDFNPYPDAKLYGETTMNYFGKSLSSAGDFNGDGYDDVIIGAWKYNDWRGRAYLFLGSSLVTQLAVSSDNKTQISAYPLPFHNQTNIQINNIQEENLYVAVYDANGKMIKTLYNGIPKERQLKLTWKTSSQISAGTYYCIIKNSNKSYYLKLIRQ